MSKPEVKFNPKVHKQRKRPNTSQIASRPNDFYVSNKSDFVCQVKQCEKFLSNPEVGQVYLHCIGNAINKGINLALKLQKNSGEIYQFEVNTSTIELLDDLHPLNDEEDYSVLKRNNSGLHIRVYNVAKE